MEKWKIALIVAQEEVDEVARRKCLQNASASELCGSFLVV